MFEIINAFLYCGLFYYLFLKGANRLVLFVISIWTVSAVLGIFYTKMDIYKYRSNDLEELQLLPFFYLFVCFVLCVRPLIKLSNLNIPIKCNTRLLDYCGILFTILSVPFFISFSTLAFNRLISSEEVSKLSPLISMLKPNSPPRKSYSNMPRTYACYIPLPTARAIPNRGLLPTAQTIPSPAHFS